MKNLHQFYATQPSAAREYKALQAEARERGMLLIEVEREHRLAEQDRRQADYERTLALINDPATLRRLRRVWAGEQLPPEPEPEPVRDPNAPPSAGKIISPGRG
jgi:hypothetical protein